MTKEMYFLTTDIETIYVIFLEYIRAKVYTVRIYLFLVLRNSKFLSQYIYYVHSCCYEFMHDRAIRSKFIFLFC